MKRASFERQGDDCHQSATEASRERLAQHPRLRPLPRHWAGLHSRPTHPGHLSTEKPLYLTVFPFHHMLVWIESGVQASTSGQSRDLALNKARETSIGQ
jgi:hypothetical protein